MAIILPKSHSEWLQERKYGIGASDAAAMLGMSKWKTNVALWEEKVGLREPEDISEKDFVRYGHDAEPHLRALFALDHPELRMSYESPYKIIRNPELPFIYCTPDGELEEIATGRKGGFENKTTEIKNASQWSEWNGRIPQQYYCQVVHQFASVPEWEFIWLNVQIKWTTRDGERRKDTREYPIERADLTEDIAYLKQGAVEFWKHVQTKTRPALKLPEI